MVTAFAEEVWDAVSSKPNLTTDELGDLVQASAVDASGSGGGQESVDFDDDTENQ